jgi:putative transcriptional regulator
MRKMKKKSVILEAVHETARDLFEAGAIDKKTMREFDELCLTLVKPLSPKQIRALRLREEASQAVFAKYLNVTTGLISQWERGEKKPQGPSLKLLTLVAEKGLDAIA